MTSPSDPIWLEASGYAQFQSIPVGFTQNPPESLRDRLSQLAKRIDQIPVSGARIGEERVVKIKYVNKKRYTTVHRRYRGVDGRSLGKENGGEDKAFKLSLQKRRLRKIEAKAAKALAEAEALLAQLEEAVDAIAPVEKRQELPASTHQKQGKAA